MTLGNLVRRLPWTGVRGSRAVDGTAPTDATVLEEADRLVELGEPVRAVDLLVETWRRTRDPGVEVRLRDLRHDAASATYAISDGGRTQWPPRCADPFPGVRGEIPQVEADEVSTEMVGGAVLHHGALCVRGLFADEQVRRTMDVLRQARATQDAGGRDRFYLPLRPDKDTLREHVRHHGGTWLADSPAATAVVLDELDSSGIVGLLTEHFGERPNFSLEKSTLRRTPPEDRVTGWHQDVSFLGAGVRTMNVWVALSACGGARPASGLEVVPPRLDRLLPKDPALGNAGVSFDLMEELLAEMPSVRPEFQPGDALVFDERFMHRTALGPELTEDRYALECWFFAPSHASADYTPLVV